MKKLIPALIGVFLFLAISPVVTSAAPPAPREQALFKVGGDGRDETDALIITDAQGNARALRIYDDVYTAEQIKDGANILIDGIDPETRALVIKGEVKPESGGTLVLDYLVNGVYGTREQLTVELHKLTDGSWRVNLPGTKQPITLMYMKAKWLLTKQIGIAQIDVTLELDPNSKVEGLLIAPRGRLPASIEDERAGPKQINEPAKSAEADAGPAPLQPTSVPTAG